MTVTTNYKNLKLCKHGLPTWDAMLPVALYIASKQSSGISRKEFSAAIVNSLQLPDNLRQLKSEKYPDVNIIDSRTTFPISELTIGGLMERPKRGFYLITPLGKQLLEQYGDGLTSEIIHKLPQFIQHQDELKQKGNLEKTEANQSVDNLDLIEPLQTVNSIVKKYNDSVSIELLERIRKGSPYFFEKLVVELLSNMGYKGINGQAFVTQKSNDSGIDGIINQDALGTSTVYIQAKRYQVGNNVGRNEMQAFFGALSGYGSDRGVFITTSDFSNGAIEYARNQHIVLINGLQLSDLMLQYQVGVNIKKQYTTFDIDEDFFIEDD
ncbi:restriction endonuclease [Latilactobacillus fragifolii]|uniref:restriction endonuclease n=1 Tax=Latilactobacillus fragifolii TaxID=2814244 RepID=UPI001ABAA9E2|nr:restriction endonuclease [Latilactobacillus fragifolii]